MKRWQSDARHFLRRHAQQLSAILSWVFSSGPVGDPSTTPDPSWLGPPGTINGARQLGARGHIVFGGRGPAQPHGPLGRAMVKNTPEQSRSRDLRNWDEIRAWARYLAAELTGPASRDRSARQPLGLIAPAIESSLISP